MAHPSSLVLVGAGKMGGAMLEGWLKGGLPGSAVTIVDPHAGAAMQALAHRHGIALNPPTGTFPEPEVLILAVKPQMLDSAAETLSAIAGPGTLVMSVVAGKTIANLKERMPRASAFVRAMPNTPAAVGRGITGAAGSPAVTDTQRAIADALLKSVGRVEWVATEELIDAVTAVSGSGPAYVFYLAECLAKAGVAAGLPQATAERLARATVEGAGELMYQDAGTEPAQLRINVTSPGGTTAAALGVLMATDGMEPLLTRAVEAARTRAGELAG